METPIKLREGRSSTRLGFGQPIRAVLQLLLPITVFTIILSYPYWPPCPSAKNLSHPLLNSLPALLDRKFMFLLCNVILVFISGNSFLVIQELPSKKKLDVYDAYVSKKNEFSVTQMSNIVVGPKSTVTAAKMGSQRTSVDILKEKKEVDAERASEARVAAEEQLILDGLEREEEEEHFVEQDRRFDEFIARKYENWRREQQQLATEFQRKKKVENHENGLVFSEN